MGYHFIDTDDLITTNCHLLYKQSEELFRQLEKQVIGAIEEFHSSVIATGGGSILDPDNVAVFKKMGKIIYLQVEKEELRRRIFANPLPAFLDPANPESSFEKMYAEREPLYRQIADEILT